MDSRDVSNLSYSLAEICEEMYSANCRQIDALQKLEAILLSLKQQMRGKKDENPF